MFTKIHRLIESASSKVPQEKENPKHFALRICEIINDFFDKEKIDLDRLEYFIGGQLVSIGEYIAYQTRGNFRGIDLIYKNKKISSRFVERLNKFTY